MQGWRRFNEDAHLCITDIDQGIHLFAVFDGHGGNEVAKFWEKYFVSELKSDYEYKNKNYQEALKNTMIKLDRRLLQPEGQKEMLKIFKQCMKGQ